MKPRKVLPAAWDAYAPAAVRLRGHISVDRRVYNAVAALAGSRDPDWVGAKEPGAWEPFWNIDGLLLEAHALAPKRPQPIPLPKRKRRRR